MKISFIGLSCFMIENKEGFRVLVDPFNALPEWSLGPKFPQVFNGEKFGANIVLMSEPDADHSYSAGDWLQHGPRTKPSSNPFSGLNLKGTVVYEYNGDLNIAYHYTIDGLRIAHFADNAHALTEEQIAEIGQPDIIFISPPKTEPGNEQALENIRQDIKNLNPKLVIWAHHIAPNDLPTENDSKTLQTYFKKYFKNHASTNQFYDGENSFIQLCYIYENALVLNQEYNGIVPEGVSFEVDSKSINDFQNKTTSVLFKKMLSE